MSRLLVLAVLATVVPAMHTCQPPKDQPTEASWPAVDDGCPAGFIGNVQPGWDYRDGSWYAFGVLIGVAPEEDSCIKLVTS